MSTATSQRFSFDHAAELGLRMAQLIMESAERAL